MAVVRPDSRAAFFEALADEEAREREEKGLGRLTGVRVDVLENQEETAFARKRKWVLFCKTTA